MGNIESAKTFLFQVKSNPCPSTVRSPSIYFLGVMKKKTAQSLLWYRKQPLETPRNYLLFVTWLLATLHEHFGRISKNHSAYVKSIGNIIHNNKHKNMTIDGLSICLDWGEKL